MILASAIKLVSTFGVYLVASLMPTTLAAVCDIVPEPARIKACQGQDCLCPDIFSKSSLRKMFSFAHFYRAAMVDCSKENQLMRPRGSAEIEDWSLATAPSGFSDIAPGPERPGSKRPPDGRFAVRSGVNPRDRSPR